MNVNSWCPSARTNTCRSDDGFTLVEMIVAVLIISIAILIGSQVLATGYSQLAEARARDRAVASANDIIEQARAFGCGLSVGVEAQAVLDAREENCFGGETNATGGRGGTDITFNQTRNGVTYTIDIDYRWVRLDSSVVRTGCRYLDGSTVPSTDHWEPDGLLRTVTTSWTRNGSTHSYVAQVIESIPPDSLDFNAAARGSIFVKADAAGDEVTMTSASTAAEVTRTADKDGCAWFPYVSSNDGYSFETSSGGTAEVSTFNAANGSLQLDA